MICADARELFSPFVDEALGPAERAVLEQHLADCAECPRELERFRATVALLRAVEPERAPAGFVDRVLAARPVPWHRRLLRTLLVPWPVKLPLEALALGLVVVAVTHFVRARHELQATARVETSPPADPAARGIVKILPRSSVDSPLDGPLAQALKAADVVGELRVKERESAVSMVSALVGKTGGVELGRIVTPPDATTLELRIPRAAWGEFVRELAKLGAWTPEQQPAELPAEVRVALRIVE
jgi:anti-sigma factor RsiW